MTSRRRAAVLVPVLLAWLVACSSTAPAPEAKPPASAAAPPVPPEPVAAPPVEPPAPARPSLAAEQRRLAALFRGTPVVFAMQPDGRLRVDVPLQHSFDAGRSAVKAPLAAVLDRVALSQAGGSSRIVVSAPGDRIPPPVKPSGGVAVAPPSKQAGGVDARRDKLVADRGKAIVDRLVVKGIASGRVSTSPTTGAGAAAGSSAGANPGANASASTVAAATAGANPLVRLLVEERPAP